MASHGIVFAADGRPRSAWTWHGKDACPFVMPVEPGGVVVHLDDKLTADALAAVTRGLVTSPNLDERHVKARHAIPATVSPQAGEALGYKPTAKSIVSRSNDGRESPVHTFDDS